MIAAILVRPQRPPALRTAPPPKRTRRDNKREQLVEIARDEFAAHGFAATQLQVVAARAGIRKSTLHHYFVDKEALYEVAVVQLLDDVADGVEAAANDNPLFGSRLDAIAACVHGHIVRRPLLARLLLRSLIDAPPLAAIHPLAIERILAKIAHTIAVGVAERRIPPTDATRTAPAIAVLLFAVAEVPLRGRVRALELLELQTQVRRLLMVDG